MFTTTIAKLQTARILAPGISYEAAYPLMLNPMQTSEYLVSAIPQNAAIDALLETIEMQAAEIRRLKEEREFELSHLDNFSDQVLRNFEERNWLVRMSDHLRICDVTRDIYDVAGNLLSELKLIVRADAVAFAADSCLAEPESSSHRIVIDNGKFSLTDDMVCQIIERFRDKALDRPFIWNLDFNGDKVDRVPDMKSLMLIAVARNHQVVGWLLAVNRPCEEPDQPRFVVDPEDADFRDEGFGTAEAGLMNSAAAVLATHQHNLNLFRANRNLTISVIKSMANAVDARDTYTRGHSERVGRMARQLAHHCGQEPQLCEQFFMTGLLHDVGKIGVPDRVLLKPSSLDDEEYAIMKRHPSIGHRILEHIEELSYTLDGVLYHHEGWNGKGYPEGLKSTEIPFLARVLAVVDAYDAMTSRRPYRDGMPFEKAETILQNGAGEQWDPEIVATFLQHREDFHRICREFDGDCHSVDFPESNTQSQPANNHFLSRPVQLACLRGEIAQLTSPYSKDM